MKFGPKFPTLKKTGYNTGMQGYTLTQSELTGLRAKLRKAVATRDPKKVRDTVIAAYAIFEEKGWPDDWSSWERADFDSQMLSNTQKDWV